MGMMSPHTEAAVYSKLPDSHLGWCSVMANPDWFGNPECQACLIEAAEFLWNECLARGRGSPAQVRDRSFQVRDR